MDEGTNPPNPLVNGNVNHSPVKSFKEAIFGGRICNQGLKSNSYG
jgi:hypothetical protein